MPIRHRKELLEYLDADLAAYKLPRWTVRARLFHDRLRYQRNLRYLEYATGGASGPAALLLRVYFRWRTRRLGRWLGLEIPPGVVGPGLRLVHTGLIIISERAQVGRNCRIHAGVNIGEWRGKAPVIGDNVYIGPGAKIVGGVTVGDKAVIGANAVVSKDVPPGVTVGGVPAKIISGRDSTEIIEA
jgi:serine O-acetyltransferase